MNEEVEYYLKRLEATNAAMEALAEKVKEQSLTHISEIQKSMTAHSLFLETL